MHTDTVENSATPSTEAAPDSEPAWVKTVLGDAIDNPTAPPLICAVVDEIVGAVEAEPELVAAVALATLAAAVGPKTVVGCCRREVPIQFNVVISHDAPRTLPWVDVLMAPFLGQVFDAEATLSRRGVRVIREDNERLWRDLQQARNTVQPNSDILAQLEADLERAPSRLKPFVATGDVSPKKLEWMVQESFDAGVVTVAVGNDPGAALLELKPGDRRHLIELLNRSWNGIPLSFDRATISGALSLIWQTRTPVRSLLGPRGFDPNSLTVPALFLKAESKATPVPKFDHEVAWANTLRHVFDQRCLVRAAAFGFSPEAEAVLIAFSKNIAETVAKVPPGLRPHISWLPELAPRLAVLFWILGSNHPTVIDVEATSEAIETTKWLARQHLRTLAADGTANADKTALLVSKIKIKAPISRRDLRRSFDNQRVRWFDEALDVLIENKIVRYRDDGLLIPCD